MSNFTKLSPPWVIFYREMEALFKEDPDIQMTFDESKKEITMRVDNAGKAEALSRLLPVEKFFGNVSVKITIIPPNGFTATKSSLFEQAFEGNPIFTDMLTVEGVFANPLSYLIFRKEVVQFYTDNLGDANGLRSTLYQDIARDVFGDTEGVYFCTSEKDPE